MAEINFVEYAPDYRQHLDDSTLKSNTVEKRKSGLNEFIEYCEENKLIIDTDEFYDSVDDIRAFFEDPEVNVHGTKVSAIRDFLNYIGTQVDSRTEDQIDDIREKVSMAKLQGNNQDIGRMDKEEIESKLLSDEQIEAAKKQGTDKAALVIDLLLDTACRPGELAAMKPEDVDFDKGSFHVNETWSDAKGFVQKGPKHDSFRKVKINDEALEKLEDYIEKKDVGEEEYVFRYRSDIYRPVKDAYTTAQVKVENGTTSVVPHDHRHNACTRLIQNGNPKEKVQEYLGHGSIKITEHYEHFSDENVVDVKLA